MDVLYTVYYLFCKVGDEQTVNYSACYYLYKSEQICIRMLLEVAKVLSCVLVT